MNLFQKLIRAIERNSRSNERRYLVEELEDMMIDTYCIDHRSRIHQIEERLRALAKSDLNADLNRNKPLKSVSQMVKEDDCGVPEGLVGEWRAPV